MLSFVDPHQDALSTGRLETQPRDHKAIFLLVSLPFSLLPRH